MAGLLLAIVAAMLLLSGRVVAQRVEFTYKTYGLEVDADNVIQNAGYLDDFFESL